MLQPASLWPYIRGFTKVEADYQPNFYIILLISVHPLPGYITPWEEQMTSGDVPSFAIRAVQFRRANDHVIFGRVRSRLGRKSWVAAARVACAEAHCLGSKCYLSKLYERKAKSIELSYIN